MLTALSSDHGKELSLKSVLCAINWQLTTLSSSMFRLYFSFFLTVIISDMLCGRASVVRCVIRSIPHDGPIELYLRPASAPQLVEQRLWYMLSHLWDSAYKKSQSAIWK